MATVLTPYSVRDFMSYLYNLGMCKSPIHISDVESMYTLTSVRVDSWFSATHVAYLEFTPPFSVSSNFCKILRVELGNSFVPESLNIFKYDAMLISRSLGMIVTVNVPYCLDYMVNDPIALVRGAVATENYCKNKDYKAVRSYKQTINGVEVLYYDH